jgi:transposase
MVGLAEGGKSPAEIAKIFNTKSDRVAYVLKKYEKTGSIKDRPRSGAPRKTNEREDRHLYTHCRQNPGDSSRYIASTVAPNIIEKKVSRDLVQRRLRETGLKPYVAPKKPLLSEAQKTSRFEWAKKHLDWTEEDWRKVAFSDETPLCLYQSYGRKFVWCFPGEQYLDKNIKKTVKHGGGKIQIWGIFTYWGAGPLYRINGIMDGPKYREILKRHMAPHLKGLEGKTGVELIFQHDNDPKHTSKVVKNYLSNKQMTVLEWASQSPDMNAIEHGWRQLKMRIAHRTYKAKNLDEVFDIAQEEWNNIPLAAFQELIDSMPRRVRACYEAKGGHTKY